MSIWRKVHTFEQLETCRDQEKPGIRKLGRGYWIWNVDQLHQSPPAQARNDTGSY